MANNLDLCQMSYLSKLFINCPKIKTECQKIAAKHKKIINCIKNFQEIKKSQYELKKKLKGGQNIIKLY